MEYIVGTLIENRVPGLDLTWLAANARTVYMNITISLTTVNFAHPNDGCVLNILSECARALRAECGTIGR
jgi:hypothetical protein